MQTNLLWTGREYHSMENCLVKRENNYTTITSTIIGYYQNKIYQVDYHIEANRQWETLLVEINCRHSDQVQQVKFERNSIGNWYSNGNEQPAFKGCVDVDISLTPFTNSLPINRLQLKQHEAQEITVIYFDLLTRQIKPATQKYTRLTNSTYRYENVPNDFEAVIEIDASGFVVDYPSLFVRTAVLNTNY
jgi:hypothetical protein